MALSFKRWAFLAAIWLRTGRRQGGSLWKLCVVTAWPDELPRHGRSGLGGRSLQLLISISLAISLARSAARWNDPRSVFVSLNCRRTRWGEAGGRRQLCRILLMWFCRRESACALQVEGNFPIISEKIVTDRACGYFSVSVECSISPRVLILYACQIANPIKSMLTAF